MIYTLKSFNTGQVTLPKKWRVSHETNSYIAEETKEGLLIKPIIISKQIKTNSEDIEYFEDSKGMTIKFKKGVTASELIKVINENV